MKAKYRAIQIRAFCLSHSQAVAFLELCGEKVRRATTEPGTAVGAIAATSIGALSSIFPYPLTSSFQASRVPR